MVLKGCLLGQLRGGKPPEELIGLGDEGLVRQVLRDLGQELVDAGHVTVTIQHLLFTVQDDLDNQGREDGKLGDC